MKLWAVCFVIALSLPEIGMSQTPPWLKEPYLIPAIYGQILDSATGMPVARMGLRIEARIGETLSDSAGWYLLFSLPEGSNTVHFFCPARRAPLGREWATRTVTVGPRTDSSVTFRMPVTGCVDVPERTWTGEFRGHYVSGFEASDFVPCEPFESLDSTAYDGREAWAWVDFADSATMSVDETPGGAGADPNLKVFVRWRASIKGPGSYGHLGAATYSMMVEHVLEAHVSRPGDCR